MYELRVRHNWGLPKLSPSVNTVPVVLGDFELSDKSGNGLKIMNKVSAEISINIRKVVADRSLI